MDANGTDYYGWVSGGDDDLSFRFAANNDSNWTGVDALPAAVHQPHWLADPCSSFRFFFNTVFIGSLCTYGVVTNLLSVAVLHRDRHHRVATFLLQSLAVADTSVLLVVFVVLAFFVGTASVPGVYVGYTRFAIPYLKKYVNPLGYMTQCSVIWLTVIIAVNRYIAVCHPFKAYRFLTINIARIQVATVFALSVLFNVPRFFQYDVEFKLVGNSTVPRKQLTMMGDSRVYDIFYLNVFYTAVLLIFPMFVLIVLNSIIIRQLRISKHNMRNNSLQYIGSQEKNITLVIIVIIMIGLLSHTPDRILTVFKAIHRPEDKECPDPQIFASHFCNLLIIINSSSNFVVYCVFRKRFRRILCRMVCPRWVERRRRRRESNGSVRSMSESGASVLRNRSLCGAPLLVATPTSPTSYDLASPDLIVEEQRLRSATAAIGRRLSDYGCPTSAASRQKGAPVANGHAARSRKNGTTGDEAHVERSMLADVVPPGPKKKQSNEVTFML